MNYNIVTNNWNVDVFLDKSIGNKNMKAIIFIHSAQKHKQYIFIL